ncbi:ABC transporter substrate-binding protein [Desulfallas thermosapovorans]|uniref:Peptide/nickel transport system substrate-binding protein n=1 Tax=Desulfallas thermosapovorans DSM 6562 TaxID=1121431 RepID=A0A5S4ZNY9_9FIRM|nr:ABC transporter substrate-binding protein [Desulfallas thermosapovorans]TYO93877.1 peptide/nickel transport system substrate-binding protein [Desulfallas thermosapovorans DSM 6562]
MTRSLGVLVISLFCLLLLAVFIKPELPTQGWLTTGRTGNNSTTGTGGTSIIIAQKYTVSTLDPAAAADTGSIRVIANIYEGLVRFKPGTTKIEPCLAQSWKVSEDGLIYTFDLRRNVSFHDGTPLDARAVQYSVQRQLTGKSTKNTAYAGFVYAPLDKVKVIDRHTIEFHLKYPYAAFLNNLAMPMAAPVVSPAAPRLQSGKLGAHPAGTGPFIYAGEKNGGLVLQANPDYWAGPARGEILFLTIPKADQRVQQLLSGQVDIALDLTFAQTARLRFKGYPVLRATGLDIGYLGFYTDRRPFNEPGVRQAVAAALNYREILEELWPQETRPAHGPLPPTVLGYDKGITQIDYAPDKCARLLKEAGYDKGLSFDLITYEQERPYAPGGGKVLAEALARSLAGHGISVQVRSYPWQQFKQALSRREGDAFLYGWISDNGDPDNFLYTLLAANQVKSGLNITRYHNEELETLLVSGRHTNDPEMRQQIYRAAQQVINRDVPWLVLNHSLHYAATSPLVKGFILSPTDWPLLNGVSKN